MPRLLSSALIAEKNRVESDHVFTMLFEAQISGAPVPYRLAAYDQDIAFHGLFFPGRALDVDSLEDPTTAALVSLRVTLNNVDQEVISLLENYWVNVVEPRWTVTIWQIDAMQPDQTPYGVGDLFAVTQVATDFRAATFELVAEGLTLTQIVPRRRFTTSSGFLNIVRRN
ncbi:MAG TPA: hypothetical protein VF077_12520 [Nitrospiraceae bacterium]